MADNTYRVAIAAETSQFNSAMRGMEESAKRTGTTIRRNMENAGGGFDVLNKSMKQAKDLMVGGTVGIALEMGLRSVISAAMESEKEAAKLEATWRATGRGLDVSTETIKRQAGAFSSLTGIDDEVVVGANAILAVYDNIATSTFPRVIEQAANLSVLMGTDLKTATTQLAFALNDPIDGLTRLRRAGIQFSEEQQKTIKTMMEAGNAAGAQAKILDTLEKRIGGVAAEVGGSMVGNIQKGVTAWGNLKEAIGGAIGASNTFKETTTFWTDFFNKIAQGDENQKKKQKAEKWFVGAGIKPEKTVNEFQWTTGAMGKTRTVVKKPVYSENAYQQYEEYVKKQESIKSYINNYTKTETKTTPPPQPPETNKPNPVNSQRLTAFSDFAFTGMQVKPYSETMSGMSFEQPGLGQFHGRDYGYSAIMDEDRQRASELSRDMETMKIQNTMEGYARQRALAEQEYTWQREELVAKYGERSAAVEALEGMHAETMTAIDRDMASEMESNAQAFGDRWGSTLASLVMNSNGSFSDIAENFKKMLEGMAIQAAASWVIKSLFTAATGGAGGALAFLPGFDEGGFTGKIGKKKVAGVVHGGEYVIPERVVSKTGPGVFDQIVKGYESGGYVGNGINTNISSTTNLVKWHETGGYVRNERNERNTNTNTSSTTNATLNVTMNFTKEEKTQIKGETDAQLAKRIARLIDRDYLPMVGKR